MKNYLKSITVLQPKLWRKQTGKDEQRWDNRPIILVPTCFCSSCLLSCWLGDSNLPTKSLTGPLARESKHKNKESTFPAAGWSECWSSPEAIRSGRGLRAPIVSLYFVVWETCEHCCFFLLLLLLHPSPSSLPVSLCACFFFFFLRASSPGNRGQRPQFDSAVWRLLFEFPLLKILPVSVSLAGQREFYQWDGVGSAPQEIILMDAAEGRKLDFTRCHWLRLLFHLRVFFH